MKKILLLLSVISVVTWVIGFFVFRSGSLIHVILFIAILSYLRSLMCVQGAIKYKI